MFLDVLGLSETQAIHLSEKGDYVDKPKSASHIMEVPK